MLKKIFAVTVLALLVSDGKIASCQEASTAAEPLTYRQELLKQLRKDTEEVIFIPDDTVAKWGVTHTSGEPLEILESVLVTEKGIVETTVWTIGQTILKSVLIVKTTDEGSMPQLVANVINDKLEIKWQYRPFSPDELRGILEYAKMLTKMALTVVGVASDEDLKKYIEKDHI